MPFLPVLQDRWDKVPGPEIPDNQIIDHRGRDGLAAPSISPDPPLEISRRLSISLAADVPVRVI
jgi:hypothetical protein